LPEVVAIRTAGIPRCPNPEDGPIAHRPVKGWCRRRDQTRFWAEVIAAPLRQAAGTLVGFGVIVHDLTPHGLTEECAAILDSVPDAVIGINASGRIVSANQAAGTIFGYGRAELAGLDVQLLVPAELRVHLRSLLDREVPAGGGDADPRPHRRRRNLTGLRSDGGWFSAEVSLASVVTAQGLVTIAVVRDVSGDRPTTAAPEADATAPRGATV
jgi:PAS domain S-box-containing protein